MADAYSMPDNLKPIRGIWGYQMKTRKIKRFYTMVELLVTTSVIAALASLLLPGMERAKGIAKKVYCLNNIRQIGLAANCYWNDNENLPYSSTWLIDFSFATDYVDYYDGMVCPDTDDSVNTSADLVGNTSYHYMGSRDDWTNCNEESGDGSEYGFDSSNSSITNMLSDREEKVIYDRTDLVHNGFFNVLFLASMHTESINGSGYSDYWYYSDTGELDFTGDRDRNCNRNRYRHRHRNGNGDGEHNGDENNADDDGSGNDDSGNGNGNNGHGNNDDGVDCSNPGNGNGGPNGEEDESGDVDDESGNGNNGNGNNSNDNNGNGNGCGNNDDDDDDDDGGCHGGGHGGGCGH